MNYFMKNDDKWANGKRRCRKCDKVFSIQMPLADIDWQRRPLCNNCDK